VGRDTEEPDSQGRTSVDDTRFATDRLGGGIFVGREREVEELRGALREAESGRGSLFLLSGEPGIGKTRLADRVANFAVERGFQVAWGRCREGEGAPPFWPCVQLLRTLVEASTSADLASRIGSGAAYLAQLVPELAEKLPSIAPAPVSLESEHARFYLFDAITSFLKKTSRVKPLLLVVDDLHWADRSSLHLVEFLVQELREARILLLGTYRETEVRSAVPIAEIVGGLVRCGRSIPLRGLGESDVGVFLERIGKRTPEPQLVAAIHRRTDGNPFFVDEIVRLLAAEGGHETVPVERLRIPEGVRAAIRRRLSLLPREVRILLSLCAVVGREFTVVGLEKGLGQPRPELMQLIATAEEAGVLGKTPEAPGRYGFAHALIGETLYDDLTVADRTLFHRRIGEALEEIHVADMNAHLAEVAYHFSQAAADGDAAKALDYSERAGRHAFEIHADEEAIGHFERALQLLALEKADEARRCRLLISLGEAESRVGRSERSQETQRKAAEIAIRLRLPNELARAALLFGSVFGAETRSIELLESALEALPGSDSTLRALVMTRLGATLLYTGIRPERALPLVADAVSMARRLGDRRVLARALTSRITALWISPDAPPRPTPPFTDVAEIVRACGDPEIEFDFALAEVRAFLALGDLVSARARLDRWDVAAGDLRAAFHRDAGNILRATFDLIAGRFDEAEQRLRGILERARSGGFRILRSGSAVILFALDKLRGDWAAIDRAPRDDIPMVPGATASIRCAEVVLLATRGRQAEAGRELAVLAADDFASIPRSSFWMPAIAYLAEAAALLGDAERALLLHRQLVPHAGRMILLGSSASIWGTVDHYLGLVAATASRFDEAEKHFEDAVALEERMGAEPWIAQTQHFYAKMCLQRAGEGDRAKASHLLEAALATAERLGMKKIAADSRLLLEGLAPAKPMAPDLPAEPAREPVAAGNVFRREGAYWTIAWEGQTFRLKDTKGLRFLSALLAEPGREFHALDLTATTAGMPALAGTVDEPAAALRADLGDAGEILDAEAKAQYRQRLDDLRADLEEAERFNDPERATRNREEIEFLTEELARATGLGGRDRKAASAAERARTNVTMAIRAALKRIAEQNPSLGRHFAATVRTGKFCSYTPDPRITISWRA